MRNALTSFKLAVASAWDRKAIYNWSKNKKPSVTWLLKKIEALSIYLTFRRGYSRTCLLVSRCTRRREVYRAHMLEAISRTSKLKSSKTWDETPPEAIAASSNAFALKLPLTMATVYKITRWCCSPNDNLIHLLPSTHAQLSHLLKMGQAKHVSFAHSGSESDPKPPPSKPHPVDLGKHCTVLWCFWADESRIRLLERRNFPRETGGCIRHVSPDSSSYSIRPSVIASLTP